MLAVPTNSRLLFISLFENYLSFLRRSTKYPHLVLECRRTRQFNFSVFFVYEAYIVINHALIIFSSKVMKSYR